MDKHNIKVAYLTDGGHLSEIMLNPDGGRIIFGGIRETIIEPPCALLL